MALYKNTKIKKYNEIWFYFIYFFKFFNIFIYFNNNLFLYKIHGFLITLNRSSNFFLNHFETDASVTKKLITYSKSDFFNFLFLKKNPTQFNNKLIAKRLGKPNSSRILLKLFNLFFLFNYTLFDDKSKPHGNYKLFYIKDFSNKIVILDTPIFLARWKDAYSLLFNTFWYEINMATLGSPVFKDEILAINWSLNYFNIDLWRYHSPFFIFKTNNYSKLTDFFFDKFYSHNKNFFVITDCFYHFKNLHYLKKKNYYSLGLVDAKIDPWMVTYPIISFFESYVTQLFFFKLLIFIQKQTSLLKFNYFKNNWLNFFKVTKLKLLN